MRKLLLSILFGLWTSYALGGDCSGPSNGYNYCTYWSSEWKECRGYWSDLSKQIDCETDAENEYYSQVLVWTLVGTVVVVGGVWLYHKSNEGERWTPPERPASFAFKGVDLTGSFENKEVGIEAKFTW